MRSLPELIDKKNLDEVFDLFVIKNTCLWSPWPLPRPSAAGRGKGLCRHARGTSKSLFHERPGIGAT